MALNLLVIHRQGVILSASAESPGPDSIVGSGFIKFHFALWSQNRLKDWQKEVELELELTQTQMTQKPMLRAEVYARALRASQYRKENSV